jgi:hypothetical protein
MHNESGFFLTSHEENLVDEPKKGVKSYDESEVKRLWEWTRGRLWLQHLEEFKTEDRQKVVETILSLTFDEFDKKLSSILGKLKKPTDDIESLTETARYFPEPPSLNWLHGIKNCDGLDFSKIYSVLKSRVDRLDEREKKYIESLSEGLSNKYILEGVRTPFHSLVQEVILKFNDKLDISPEDCYTAASYAFNHHFVESVFRVSGLFKKMTNSDKSRFVKQILQPIQEGPYKGVDQIEKIVHRLLFLGTTRGEDYEVDPEMQAGADQSLADFQDYLGELMIGTLNDKGGKDELKSFAKRLPKRFEQVLGMVKNEEERKKIQEMLREPL